MTNSGREEAIRSKNEALDRVGRGASEEWKLYMHDIIDHLGYFYPEICTDEIWVHEREVPEPKPHHHENRALGRVMLDAAKAGVLIKTPRFRNSVDGSRRHHAPLQIWTCVNYGKTPPPPPPPPTPKEIEAMRPFSDLRHYQLRIADDLYGNDEKICVLRPGGGKTIAALTAIKDLLDQGVIKHALVIAPKRVARVVWPDEIMNWMHTFGLKYAVLEGSPAQRFGALIKASTRQLTIVGIDVIPWLLKEIERFPPEHALYDLLVIDEISKLRDPKGVRSKALAERAHKWRMVWGLTGTLRPSSAQDFFMPARIVTRNKLWGKSFYKWQKTHFYPTDHMRYDWKPLPGHEDGLNVDIAPLITTVAEGELIQPKPTIILDRIELPELARAKYNTMQDRLFAKYDDEGGEVVAASSAIATGKLAQIANGFIYDDGQVARIHEAKREWLEDLIENATGPSLLIYEFLEDLALMKEVIPNLRYLGGGISDAQAAANIALWNKGLLPFMGLHPASGGHGLNLQFGGADMAWMSPTWSPELWDQTIARINRSGQKRQVMVRVCVAEQTVDELKLSRVYGKLTAQQAFENYMMRWRAMA